MFCPACREANDADARFCDRCGSDLTAKPASGPPSVQDSPPKGPPALPAPHPPLVYAPVRPRAWWYPIGVWGLLSAFFLFLDAAPGDGIGWASWPIGVLGIFMVGFPLLGLLETWSAGRRKT